MRPKLQEIALNKGILLLPLDLWSWAHLYPEKSQIAQKLIMVFIES